MEMVAGKQRLGAEAGLTLFFFYKRRAAEKPGRRNLSVHHNIYLRRNLV